MLKREPSALLRCMVGGELSDGGEESAGPGVLVSASRVWSTDVERSE